MSREEGDRIQDYFVRFFKTKTRSEILDEALKRRIMIQSVNTPKEILGHYQLEARSYWQQLEHSDLDVTLNYPSRFCLLSETPGRLWRRAPHIGEHNQEIYHEELGFSVEELVSLKQAGII